MLLVPVVAGCIYNEREKKVLLVKRSPGDRSFDGKWEFPGGKVEDGEGLREALGRELREGLGLPTWIGRLLNATINSYPEYPTDCIVLFYLCDLPANLRDKIRLGVEYCWIHPTEISDFDTLPGVVETANILISLIIKDKWKGEK